MSLRMTSQSRSGEFPSHCGRSVERRWDQSSGAISKSLAQELVVSEWKSTKHNVSDPVLALRRSEHG